jgi:hypothetical protein
MSVQVLLWVPYIESEPYHVSAYDLTAGSPHDVIAEQLPTLTLEMEQELACFTTGDVQLVARNDDGWWDTVAFIRGAADPNKNTNPFSRYPICHYVQIYRDNVLRFEGDVDVRSASFDRKARTVSFSALGPLARLKAFSAEDCRRIMPNVADFGAWTSVGSGWMEDTTKHWTFAAGVKDSVVGCCLIDSALNVFPITGRHGFGVGDTTGSLALGTANTGATTPTGPTNCYYIRPMVLATSVDWHDGVFYPGKGSATGISVGAGFLQDTHKAWVDTPTPGSICPIGLFMHDSVGGVYGPITSVSNGGKRINWPTSGTSPVGDPRGANETDQGSTPTMYMGIYYHLRKSEYNNLLESLGPTIATLGLLGVAAEYAIGYEDDFSSYALASPVVPSAMPDWNFAFPAEWSVVAGKWLRQVPTSDHASGATYKTDAASQDSHVLCKVKASANQFGAYVQMTGGTALCAWIDVNAHTVNVGSLSGGVVTAIATPDATLAPAAGTWYWLRLLIQGSSVYVKAWADGMPEPLGWTFDPTKITTPWTPQVGNCGLASVVQATYDCAAFQVLAPNGVGVAGDTLTLTSASGPVVQEGNQGPGLRGWKAETTDVEVQFVGPLDASANGPLVMEQGDATGLHPLNDHQLWLLNPFTDEVAPSDGMVCATPYYRGKTPAQLAALLFASAIDAFPHTSINVQDYSVNDVRYADFAKKSLADALTELALVSNATLFCRFSGASPAGFATHYFARRDVGVGTAIDLSGLMADGVTPKLTERQDGLMWEHWWSSASVKGADKQEVIKGSLRPGGQQQSVSSDFFSTYDWLEQVADRLYGFFGKIRATCKVKVKAEVWPYAFPPDILQSVMLPPATDPTGLGTEEWWIVGAREPLREGPGGQRADVELDLISATGVEFVPPDLVTSDLSATPVPPVVVSVAYDANTDDPRPAGGTTKCWTVTLSWPWAVGRLLGFQASGWQQTQQRPTTPTIFKEANSGLGYDPATGLFTVLLYGFQLQVGTWVPEWVDFQAVMIDGRTSEPSTPTLLVTS